MSNWTDWVSTQDPELWLRYGQVPLALAIQF